MRLFEWEDQPWLPTALRDFVTDHLRATFAGRRGLPLRETIARILAPPLSRSGADRVVDVCSGGGGPLPVLLPLLEETLGRSLRATLTDLYPNVRTFAAIEAESRGIIRGERASVSAFEVPAHLGEFETLFTAFHHFDESGAKRILSDAVAKRRTIVVVEPFRRRDALVVAFGGFLRGVFATPFVGRLSLARLLWTYPIPISAGVLAWDGFVSCLRAYSAEEMLSLARLIEPSRYRWESGVAPIEGSPLGFAITYLIGEPDSSAGHATQSEPDRR